MGTIPDMHSTTENFVKLQTIYRDKAAQDAHAVYDYAQQVLCSPLHPGMSRS